ncbi:TIGR00730 family Rossman fold protein [Helicobacter turcicus]|uniref:Cytokinin riboside 5'-monophosphate phosphoribohydrolase n=1 Tax=Helicobacter turcicus TaxID=2867412 RepID=A0ABS7JLQ8_9HELI|nr:TIGR00730 family Rossman fold protein [Helicobacter turcicus]MBX7490315.1 TIGR00730 family Rossman fold protein [Helicobacter turcicus]MBX7545106.1 TIGR00730 family Rossman fold protein [Helicobacter turcicus]
MDLDTLREEISKGLQTLEQLENIITIFGGSRVDCAHTAYHKIQELTYILGAHNYSIMTGGGPGIMEAANRGLMQYKQESKNDSIFSIGLNIQLPHEQKMNPYVEIPLEFQNFFSRKLVFNYNSTAFIVAMGGYGTLDELSEVLVQIATGKHKRIPIILYGKDYWSGFLTWLETKLLDEGVISKVELELLTLVDSPNEVLEVLECFKKSDFPNHTS